MTLISPAAGDALETWLTHQRALKGAAENTLTAYRGDVVEFCCRVFFFGGLPSLLVTGSGEVWIVV